MNAVRMKGLLSSNTLLQNVENNIEKTFNVKARRRTKIANKQLGKLS
jgi:hypothetical protein